MPRPPWIVAGVGLATLLSVAVALPAGPQRVDCPPHATLVVVDTKTHTLALCEKGRAARSFSVRLGKHGTDKRRQGDGKTPIGSYGLGEGRASSSFGIFIPVAYPTPEQRADGYTGTAIGVHGPGRGVRWLGKFVNTFDLSDGCVGIATDEEMTWIAAWVRRLGVHEILIR